MTAELKPCPFCGGDKNTICKTDYDGRDSYAVSCRYPECHGAIFTLGYGYFADEAEAIAAWNTRADLSQSAIAAAMMGALDNFPADWRERAEEMRGVFKMQKAWSDGFNAARAALAASIPTDAAAALGAALLGAYKEGWSDGAANCHHDRNETPDDGWLISDTYLDTAAMSQEK